MIFKIHVAKQKIPRHYFFSLAFMMAVVFCIVLAKFFVWQMIWVSSELSQRDHYLWKELSRVDKKTLISATADDFLCISGFGPCLVDRILSCRDRHGTFFVEDFKDLKGFGEFRFSRFKEHFE